MARRRKSVSQRVSEGCGQGRGADYKPAIQVQDFSSKGLSTQGKGWKTGREHHFLSQLELCYFYVLDWSPIVTDIREQYPLPVEETLKIAEELGIAHPVNPDTREPNPLTVDFMITAQQKIGVANHARTIKYSKDLQSDRVLEKLEIEWKFCELNGISWGIVTEHEIPTVLVENVEWIHEFLHISALKPLTEQNIYQAGVFLTKRAIQGDTALRDIAAECDDRFGLDAGESLSVVRHLLANRLWIVDMHHKIQPKEKLVFLTSPTQNLMM